MKPDEKKCPACAETIKGEAIVCRHCGHQFDADVVAAEIAERSAKKRADWKAGGCGCLVLLLIIGALGMVFGDGGQPSENLTGATAGNATSPGTVVESAAAKRDFEALYSDVLRIAKPCDTAFSSAGAAAGAAGEGTGTVVGAYQAAKSAHQVCESAWLEMGKLDAPSTLPDPQGKKTAAALEKCVTTTYAKKSSLETLMRVLDGDARPSQVAKFQEQVQAASAGVLLCVTELAGVGVELGADL